jgi:hypothetical protein
MVSASPLSVHMFLVQSVRTGSLVHRRIPLKHLRPMACIALFRGGAVEKNGFPGHRSYQFMATFAARIAMRALQSEGGPLVMVEQRRLPFCAVVTFRARRRSRSRELRAVDVLVACLAFRGCCLEIRVDQIDFWIRRPMAANAGSGQVSAEQREGGLRMVEAREFFP